MGRLSLAARSFFRILLAESFADKVNELLVKGSEAPPVEERPAGVVPAVKPGGSDALTLLSLFQREGRLVDFLKESLGDYSDAQIGAAVRDVHRDCRSVIDRVFGLEPLCADREGAQLTVPAGFDPHRFRLTGNVTGKPPLSGVLRHHGWKATRCEMPVCEGSGETLRIIAPAEVEIG